MGSFTFVLSFKRSENKMKFLTYGLLSVLLLTYAYAGESNELSDKTDAEVLNTDYHVCTAGHLRHIIHRLTILRNRCWHTTKVRRAHCRRRIHWLLTQIRRFRHYLRYYNKRIHIYKRKYHWCRRRCYWSCNRIINYYSRYGIKKGDEELQDDE